MNIFEKAKESPSFNYWLENLPEDDLRYLSAITDEVNDDTLKDQDTFDQMVALCIYFSGRDEMSEDELTEAFGMLSINLAMEIGVREGTMTKTGVYSMLKNEETAKFSITDKGTEKVKNMINKV